MAISLVAGNSQCSKFETVDDDSNRFYRSFKDFTNIGVQQCMEMCKHYKLCEKINYNREQLTCDLMMTYETPGIVTSLVDVNKSSVSCEHSRYVIGKL